MSKILLNRRFVIPGVIALAVLFLGNFNNPPNGYTGAPPNFTTCSNCHGSSTNGLDGAIIIENFPSTITPNTTYSLTARMTNPNGMAGRGGFQAVVLNETDGNSNAGDIVVSASNPSTTTVGGREYVEHSPGLNFPASNEISWNFDWVAPAASNGDIIKVYVAGNIANGTGGTGGDYIVTSVGTGTIDDGNSGIPLSIDIVFSNDVFCFGNSDGAAVVEAYDGTPPYSYLWTSGETTDVASNLPAGVATVTVSDASGASLTESVVIDQPSAPATVSIVSQTDIDCNITFGSATAEAVGGVGNYSYTWDTGDTGSMVSNLSAGAHGVTIFDGNGCGAEVALTINEDTDPPFADAGSPAALFCNSNSVMLDGILSESGPDITLLWTTANGNIISDASSTAIEVDQAGTYTINVFNNANGCSSSASTVVTQTPSLNSNISGTGPTCSNSSNGSINLTVTGGSQPYTYDWTGTAYDGMEDPVNLPAGTYTVTITDDDGCTEINSVDIFAPASITITGNSTMALCNGLCDGNINTTVNGGTAPYSYSWAPSGSTDPNPVNLCAGDHTVTVTDSNGCIEILTFTINQPPALAVNVVTTDETSENANDGTATADITSPGTGPYTYVWDNDIGSLTQTINSLAPGVYCVVVTDANGCTFSSCGSVAGVNCNLTGTVAPTHVACFGGNDGMAVVNTNGGTAPLSYNWSTSPSNSTNTETGLSAGTYSVTVTDAMDCELVIQYDILQPAIFVAELVAAQNPSCMGDCDGFIDISVTGGTFPYSILWNNGSTDQDLSGLCSGNYIATLTDANGCVTSIELALIDPALLTVEVTTTDETSSGAMDGTAMANASGGSTPIAYLWDNGSANSSINNLAADTYCVTVTDNFGCSATNCGVVNSGDCNLLAQAVSTNPLCFGDCNGSIDVSVTGGTSPFAYNWSNGETTQDITDLCTAVYDLTITDANGCTANMTASLFVDAMTASTILTDASGPGQMDGSIDLSNQGGSNPYTYQWSNGQATQDLVNIGAGNYCVTITDQNSCTLTACWDIAECVVAITGTVTGEHQCFGICNAQIDITSAGGNPPYSYLWSNGAITEDLVNICAGTYSVTVTDASDCTGDISFAITASTELIDDFINVTDDVGGQGIGSIDIGISGGLPPYSYQWTLGGTLISNDEDPSGLFAGAYDVVVLDDEGCVLSIDQITVSDLTSISDVNDKDGLRVFPNPTSDLVHIHFGVPVSSDATIVLYGFDGQLIEANLFTQTSDGWDLDVSGLKIGVYTIGVMDGAERWWTRVVRI